MKISVPSADWIEQSTSLPGSLKSAGSGLAADLLLALALEAILGLLDHPFEQPAGLLRARGQPMIEGVAHGGLDYAGGFLGGEPILGLALELGLADKHRQHRCGRAHHVLGGNLRRFLVVDEFAVRPQALRQRRAQAAVVSAAVGCRHSVAVGAREAVLAGGPGDGPLDVAVTGLLDDAARENILGDKGLTLDCDRQVVLEATGEVEHRFRRSIVLDQLRRAEPADLNAAEQVGLRARHGEQPCRLEGGALAEDLFVGQEPYLGAAPVHRRAELLQSALRHAAREHHAIELLAARDLDFANFRQRVDDRYADAVQAARCLVGLAVELAARMQRRHDDFERRLVLELRMRVDRNATAIVHHRQIAVGLIAHLDPGGVSGNRFVHRIVDDLGEQVMQRFFVGAANVHARAAADWLQPLQHLDVGCRVGVRSVGRFACARGFVTHVCGRIPEEIA